MSSMKAEARAPTKKRGQNTLELKAKSDEDLAAAKARNVVAPTIRGAVTTEAFSKAYGELDLGAIVSELEQQNEKVKGGDISRAESLLMTQAHTLDAIFNELGRRAALNMGEYLNATERYLRLALKAQSQCRATLETLAAIKNPPVVIARQANIAHGPQQVNNGLANTGNAPVRAGNFQVDRNKLLEADHGQRLDDGTAGAASSADSAMATLVAIDGTSHQ